jgi:hypothetical protein
MADIRRTRKVPARRGMHVIVDGKPGRITSAKGGYIMVRFDGQPFSLPCHPTWHVDYQRGGQ